MEHNDTGGLEHWLTVALSPAASPFPQDSLRKMASLLSLWNYCNLLLSAFVGNLGTGARKAGTRNMCPAHLGVGHSCGHLCPGLVVPWHIWKATGQG